jgi:hypothetical protein
LPPNNFIQFAVQFSQDFKHLTLPSEDLPKLTLVVRLKPLFKLSIFVLPGSFWVLPVVSAAQAQI